MQHPQPFTPTSQSRKAARWEEQLRECLCISQGRAATPLENTFRTKTTSLVSQGGDLYSNHLIQLLGSQKGSLALPWPTWLCKVSSALLLAPAHTQLYSGTDEGPPQRPSQRPSVKTAPTVGRQVGKGEEKGPFPSSLLSCVCWLCLSTHHYKILLFSTV